MAYAADPGGVFASDTHRRTLGHLTDEAMDLQALGQRISPDAHHGLQTVDELDAVLQDLEADGYATQVKDGWKQTSKGLDALSAPLPEATQGSATPAVLGGLEANGTVD